MAVVCKFSREIVRHHFNGTQEDLHITVRHVDTGQQRDVGEWIVSRIETNLGAETMLQHNYRILLMCNTKTKFARPVCTS